MIGFETGQVQTLFRERDGRLTRTSADLKCSFNGASEVEDVADQSIRIARPRAFVLRDRFPKYAASFSDHDHAFQRGSR
jgi:hypothetical protein